MKWLTILVLASLALNALLLTIAAMDHEARITKLEKAAAAVTSER